MHEFFEASCDATPEAVAVEHGTTVLTYRQLDAWANQLAHHLRGLGVGPGSRVGILLERSPETYRALIAIGKAGAAYVPIDPGWPADRIRWLAADAGLAACVTIAKLATKLADQLPVQFTDTLADELADGLADQLADEIADQLADEIEDELTDEPARPPAAGNGRQSGVRCHLVPVDQLADRLAAAPTTRPGPAPAPAEDAHGDDLVEPLSYLIYTSGSTGRPKGVEITQANTAHYLRVAPYVYDLCGTDRVYQGMTVAFDFAVEETWVPWAAGATVVAAPPSTTLLGAELADFVDRAGITVLCCVPTLLGTLDGDLPKVRTLIVGGEVFPDELAARWCRPGRRVLNTYGPTETTITATVIEVRPGRPLTIGRPFPGYRVAILDDRLTPVPTGEVGEICVGGPGVGNGYRNRPRLTAERFVTASGSGLPGRFYRTGDLGRLRPDGEIEFLGRADSQVKIRGHRIDLGEIERVLTEDPGVAAAAVRVWPDTPAGPELAAYVTPRGGFDEGELVNRLRARLRHRLPASMVPATLDVLAALPVLASGKIDRNRLPEPRAGRLAVAGEDTGRPGRVSPRTELEAEILTVWAAELGVPESAISVDDDFFLDLGGHSLLAASTVSILRQRCRGRVGDRAAIGDLYANRTVAALARYWESTASRSTAPSASRDARADTGVEVGEASTADATPVGGAATAPPTGVASRYRWCAAAQLTGVYLLLLVLGAPAAWVVDHEDGQITLRLMVLLVLVALPSLLLGMTVVPIVGVRLAGRGLRPGRYPLWGRMYLRMWLTQLLLGFAPIGLFAGSPLLAPYLRLLGARVGRGTHLATTAVGLPSLTEIGDRVSLGYGSQLHNAVVEDGWLHIDRVSVGSDVFLGANTVVLPGARVGVGAQVGEHSLVGRDQHVPAGERWVGSPSRRAVDPDPVLTDLARQADLARRAGPTGRGGRGTHARRPHRRGDRARPAGPPRWTARLGLGFLAAILGMMLLGFAAFLPSFALVCWVVLGVGGVGPVTAALLLSGPLFVVSACTAVAVGKWLVLPVTPAGTFPVRSGLYLRKWVVDRLIAGSLAATNSLYATLYTSPWLRALGARVGAWAEVSTVSHLDPGLLTLSPGSFVADFASVGSATFHRGHMRIGPTSVGRRAFVGNASLVRSDTTIGDDSLIGVHTTPAGPVVPTDSSWLGSPALFLPRRQESPPFHEALTYRPRPLRVIERLAIEAFRVTLPAIMLSTTGWLALWMFAALARRVELGALILLAPLVGLAAVLAPVLAVVVLKWVIIGRYRPRVEPLWGRFVRRTELVTALYECVAVPALLGRLTGTPFLAPFLRLLGARIGRRTWLATTYLTEFDLVRIGDDAAVGPATALQTHLFEDRVMKMSWLTLGAGASVGARSVVLYDTEIGERARLDAMSLVMKGERLPAETAWRGIPCRPAE